jgi:hypothetical protein
MPHNGAALWICVDKAAISHQPSAISHRKITAMDAMELRFGIFSSIAPFPPFAVSIAPFAPFAVIFLWLTADG